MNCLIAIVDYGMCNLDSVKRAVEECGGSGIITSDPHDVETATHIILPGVGAFGDAMKNLRDAKLDVPDVNTGTRGAGGE